jgi:rRNA pseudouridine-1189 N-methylase Emg1 (Nep1/Mra1 family)
MTTRTNNAKANRIFTTLLKTNSFVADENLLGSYIHTNEGEI